MRVAVFDEEFHAKTKTFQKPPTTRSRISSSRAIRFDLCVAMLSSAEKAMKKKPRAESILQGSYVELTESLP